MTARGTQPDEPAVFLLTRQARARSGSLRAGTRYAVSVLLFAGTWFGAAQLCLLAASLRQLVSPLWIPSGIGLAVLLRFGTNLWPGILLASFTMSSVFGVPPLTAAGIAVGATLESLAGAWLLRRSGFDPELATLRDVALLITLGVVESTLVSATLGSWSMIGAGLRPLTQLPQYWFRWWSANALGVLIFAPLTLLLMPPVRHAVPRGRGLEALAVLLLLVVATNALFRVPLGYQYMMFPVAGWAAVRFGPRGAALASATVSVIALWHTVHGTGPFAGANNDTSIKLLQAYLALLGIASLVLAAAIGERERAQGAATEGERRLADAQALATLGSWTFDVRTQVIWWSDEMCRICGVEPRGSVMDVRTALQVVHPDELDQVSARMAESIRTGERKQSIGRVIRPDGSVRILDGIMQPVRGPDGTVRALLGTAHDITDRQDALHALGASERRFRALVEASPDTIISVTPDGRLVSLNAGFERMLGWSRDAWIGRHFGDLVHPDDRAGILALFEHALAGQAPATPFDMRVLTHSGAALVVEGVGVALTDGGRVTGGMAVMRDVTGRRHAETALRASREQLRALSQRLLDAQEAERTRIARDLHDQIGQVLSAVAMNLENLLRHREPERRATVRIQESLEAIDRAVDQVRALSFDLRPALLDDLGLSAAVAEYCRRQADRAGLALSLDVEEPDPVPQEIQTATFRILQEAVTNVLRHARASELRVSLSSVGGVLALLVRDDGIGFLSTTARANGHATHLGIIGMQERAELAGGRVDVESFPGDGTAVHAHFPLLAEAPDA